MEQESRVLGYKKVKGQNQGISAVGRALSCGQGSQLWAGLSAEGGALIVYTCVSGTDANVLCVRHCLSCGRGSWVVDRCLSHHWNGSHYSILQTLLQHRRTLTKTPKQYKNIINSENIDYILNQMFTSWVWGPGVYSAPKSTGRRCTGLAGDLPSPYP